MIDRALHAEVVQLVARRHTRQVRLDLLLAFGKSCGRPVTPIPLGPLRANTNCGGRAFVFGGRLPFGLAKDS